MSHADRYTAHQSFARDVLTVALAGGIAHWARIGDVRRDPDGALLAASGVDLDDSRSAWSIDLTDVEDAVGRVINHPEDCFAPDATVNPLFTGSIPVLLRAIRDQLDTTGYPLPRFYAERVDAVMGDIVVQVAVAGEVIY